MLVRGLPGLSVLTMCKEVNTYSNFLSFSNHYSDITIITMAHQITGIPTVCLITCSGAHQRKHQSSASPAFVRAIHQWQEIRWISLTKGLWRGKYFLLMKASCYATLDDPPSMKHGARWALRHPKSLSTWLFLQQHAHTNNTENTNAAHTGLSGVATDGFLAERASNTERVSMSWCHHIYTVKSLI